MDLITKISDIYKKLDKTVTRFQSATTMYCPSGCAICCQNRWVETTILEMLPMGLEIYRRHREEAVLASIQEKENQQDTVCVLFIADPLLREDSACSFYPWRPLLCRLFGFAVRKNKYGKHELSTCKIIKNRNPAMVQRAEIAVSHGLKVPVYQNAFMRIASLHPGMGYGRLPINQALSSALEYLYWMNPGGWGWKKAVGC
jgi:Fe-S-cluster containining protein